MEIGAGQTSKTSFLIVSIAGYDAILGMPFLQENAVTLNTADSTAYFQKLGFTLRCATQTPRTYATISSAMANEGIDKLPAFDQIYPEVFPEKEPERLPLLREGCNHVIQLR